VPDDVPFLQQGAVQQFGWSSDQQFLDAVAVAMITVAVKFPSSSVVAAVAVGLGAWLLVRAGNLSM